MYLDRYHVKHQNLPTLQASGLTIFKEEIYMEIKEQIVQGKRGRGFQGGRGGVGAQAMLLASVLSLSSRLSLLYL